MRLRRYFVPLAFIAFSPNRLAYALHEPLGGGGGTADAYAFGVVALLQYLGGEV